MPDLKPKTIITADQIVADFGAFYQDGGQGENNLHMLPFESFETKDAFTIVETDDTILRESNVEVTEILQQYQDDFTPKGEMTFEPVQIPLYKTKIDLELNPHKIQASWLGFLAANKTDVTEWPLIRYMMEVYIMKQHDADLEEKAIYKGVYAAPEPGVPGEASKVMNGIEVLVNTLITAGKVTPITVGALSATPETFVGQVESFVKSIPEKYRNMGMELNMNRTLRNRFKEGMRVKYNMQYNQINNRLEVADQENITIVGRPSMMGKTRIWCTPKYNALFGVKGFANKNSFEVEKAKREVAIYTEWWMGAGFIQPKLIFTSDGDVA